MDIVIEQYMIPLIVVGSLAIGYVLKNWMPTDDRWIPTILLVFGGISGAILLGISYESIVKGMVSGLAAVGLNQVFKQHLKLPMDADELLNMGKGDDDDE
jgi:hypothetical protein